MATTIDEIVSSFATTPVLFVGSGLTRRYLHLPNWENLLKEFANRLSPQNEFSFARYTNEASQQLNKNDSSPISKEELLPLTATIIENDFNRRWFNDPSFRQVTDSKILEQIQNSIVSPFKAEIAHYLGQYSTPDPEYTSEINDLKALPEKHLSGIITTNYDTFMESIAPDYHTYIGQNELIFSPIQELGEIYKIHGSITDPKSIIINRLDYQQFKKHEAYLASKLLTIFMEYPIIFIGYSLGDKNIRDILDRITECLNADQLKELQRRFVFVSHNHNPSAPEIKTIQQNIGNKTIPMTEINLYNYSDLYLALTKKKRSVPVRLLRLFKNEFYKYAITSEPNPAVMLVAKIDDSRINDHDLMIAIGTRQVFTASIGLVALKTDKFYHDILFNDLGADPDRVLTVRYPHSPNKLLFPVFKYLSQSLKVYPDIQKRHQINTEADYEEYFLSPSLLKYKPSYRSKIPQKTVSAIAAMNIPDYKKVQYMCMLNPGEIDILELFDFLSSNFEYYLESPAVTHSSGPTDFRRLVRIYDWLKYGQA